MPDFANYERIDLGAEAYVSLDVRGQGEASLMNAIPLVSTSPSLKAALASQDTKGRLEMIKDALKTAFKKGKAWGKSNPSIQYSSIGYQIDDLNSGYVSIPEGFEPRRKVSTMDAPLPDDYNPHNQWHFK